MRFELASGGLLEWIGRVISISMPEAGTVPRGLFILLLTVFSWLVFAGVVWFGIMLVRAL